MVITCNTIPHKTNKIDLSDILTENIRDLMKNSQKQEKYLSTYKSSRYIPFDQRKNDSKILVVNCGSSSIKLTIFDSENGTYTRQLDAHLKGINSQQPTLEITYSGGQESTVVTKKIGIADIA